MKTQSDTDTKAELDELNELASDLGIELQPAREEDEPDFIPKAKRQPNVGQTSREELQFRHEQVARWLVQNNYRKGAVKKLCYAMWGIHPRTYEDYHTAAYRLLQEAADVTHEEEYKRSCAYYDEIMASTDDDKVKVAARKAKDELTGIQKVRKHAVVGKDGQVVDPTGPTVSFTMVVKNLVNSGLPDEQLQKLVAAGEVYESVLGSNQGKGVAENVGGNGNGSVGSITGITPASS